MAVDGQLAGWLSARDVARPEAAEAVARLQAMGCQVAMLTGDAAAAAGGIARAAGIDSAHVHARLLPAEKLALVSSRLCSRAMRGREGGGFGS